MHVRSFDCIIGLRRVYIAKVSISRQKLAILLMEEEVILPAVLMTLIQDRSG